MSAISSSPVRHYLLAASTAAFMLLTPGLGNAHTAQSPRTPADVQSIRPFRVHVPDSDLADLRRRALATRWPDKEIVPDQSTGVQLARLQQLIRYWGTGYDWRAAQCVNTLTPKWSTRLAAFDVYIWDHCYSMEQTLRIE